MSAGVSPERWRELPSGGEGPSGKLEVGDRVLARSESRPPFDKLSACLELTKPTITLMNVFMAAGGLLLAPGHMSMPAALLALLGTGLAVASANALNMVLERETDGRMNRTRRRPLPAGRLSPTTAALYGVGLGLASMVILAVASNALTTALGAIALVGYVGVYTPLKRRTPLALLIGAVPGAMPPLMGWTAVSGRLDAGGLVLFTMLLLWQLPHFLAISIYCKKDYERAGIQTVALVQGDEAAKRQAMGWAIVLLPVSLLLTPVGVAGWLYFSVALVLGLWFCSVGLQGFRPGAGSRWARSFFLASLLYLPGVVVALALDTVLGL